MNDLFSPTFGQGAENEHFLIILTPPNPPYTPSGAFWTLNRRVIVYYNLTFFSPSSKCARFPRLGPHDMLMI
jgi:hypothetical protein